MRAMDIVFAFPVMLLAIGIIAMLGPGAWPTAIAIAVVYTPIFARLLRGPALVIAESDMSPARAPLAHPTRGSFFAHPAQLASVVLVQTSLLLSAAILVEASLSFLGLGTQPPAPSLGSMLSEGRNFSCCPLERDFFQASPFSFSLLHSTCWAMCCATRSIRACAASVNRR